ncbi:MAG: GntR family transcriptional regulator [Lachnospiraceae bacterium]
MKKYLQIRTELESLIRDMGGRGRLPTEQVLCKRFAISRTTLRRALLLLEEEGLVQSRQGSGYNLTGKIPERRRPAAAFLFPSLTAPGVPEQIRALETAFSKKGARLLLLSHENSPIREAELLRDLLSNPPAVLFSNTSAPGLSPLAAAYRALAAKNCRIFFLGRGCRNLPEIPAISPDAAAGTRLILSELKKRGHERILLCLEDGPCREEILYEFLSCFSEQGMSESVGKVVELPRQDLLTPGEQAKILIRILSTQLAGVSALLFSRSATALAAVSLLAARGISIPEEISAACLGEQSLQDVRGFSLARVRIRREDLALSLADFFAQKMAGREDALPALPWTFSEGNTLTTTHPDAAPSVGTPGLTSPGFSGTRS